uniref:Transposable element Tcb1 transposase n=1 Tax=Bactrocera latifrons TaxID=174628 RepID=A0A0K8UMC9_BACLA
MTYGKQVSRMTVHRELKKLRFKARRKIKKPLLTKRQQELLLKFAKAHRNWTPEQWANVFWTDESKINLHGSDGIYYVWKKSSKTITSRDVIPTLKFGGFFGVAFVKVVLGT